MRENVRGYTKMNISFFITGNRSKLGCQRSFTFGKRSDAILSLELTMTCSTKIPALLLTVTTFLLVGCPGPGDRLQPDELTSVRQVKDNVCFLVNEPVDYQPTLIVISTRLAPPQEWVLYDNPSVIVTQGELCIPPSFYRFLDDRTYVVRYILQSKKHSDSRRSIVSAIAMTNGSIQSVPLREDEATYY
ncbi:putative T6SS immunity periplasmic lipoprotein [Pectobacterium parmentieri]|uniref:Type VI secretion protein n=2 Tax=Pectobacterium parmentieri TaxID=1905730 RepID=A0A0H3I7A1_PECPM|nr:putative T6SS immunity periplasmic lipoprotein [Pectobacterium parmentieri]AFI90714.1 Putative type VI secretion protein [Pectobacterium parmentieri]AOR58337.1 hypothetical protein A8F97_05405 [Pectobacterium parmentieri]AYH06102.1 hypothetical protein C5E25_12460 [Pectobacterium parmentieri]AYH10649.1 hypothetical protein C5E24_13625 [Pectobacterium parmentieri]AYH14918.1 hypothetical protein C5E23_12410 [Pectobacterium parmentieri]